MSASGIAEPGALWLKVGGKRTFRQETAAANLSIITWEQSLGHPMA